MLIIGIDDAGRGPIIGPMILAGVLLDENSERVLKKYPIKDSKLIVHSLRIKLAKIIKESVLAFEIVKSSPEEIDAALNSPYMNLNKLEAAKSAEIINALNNGKHKIKIIIDCPSTNIKKWSEYVLENVRIKSNINLVCEHKADANYLAVSAASIIAKVEREKEVDKIKSTFGEIGSGYPSDPVTKKFLEENSKKLKKEGIIRKSWSTWKNLEGKKSQKNLSEFR